MAAGPCSSRVDTIEARSRKGDCTPDGSGDLTRDCAGEGDSGRSSRNLDLVLAGAAPLVDLRLLAGLATRCDGSSLFGSFLNDSLEVLENSDDGLPLPSSVLLFFPPLLNMEVQLAGCFTLALALVSVSESLFISFAFHVSLDIGSGVVVDVSQAAVLI